jgi:hypothetical protein
LHKHLSTLWSLCLHHSFLHHCPPHIHRHPPEFPVLTVTNHRFEDVVALVTVGLLVCYASRGELRPKRKFSRRTKLHIPMQPVISATNGFWLIEQEFQRDWQRCNGLYTIPSNLHRLIDGTAICILFKAGK